MEVKHVILSVLKDYNDKSNRLLFYHNQVFSAGTSANTRPAPPLASNLHGNTNSHGG